MAHSSERLWALDRYARYTHSDSGAGGKWKQQDDSNQPLTMGVTDVSQLVVMQASTVLESHNLGTAQTWMRGISRNDSLLFVYRFEAYTRRFRVRFCQQDDKNGEEACKDCVQYLHRFFPIQVSSSASKTTGNKSDKSQTRDEEFAMGKATVAGTSTSRQDSDVVSDEPKRVFDSDCVTLQGEITMNEMAKAVLGGTGRALPLAYQQIHTYTNPDLMPEIICLCLADPAFPAYFEKVQSVLKSMANNNARQI